MWITALKMEPGAPRLLYAPSSLSGVTAAAKSTMKKATHTVWPCGPVESIYSAQGSNRDSDSPTCCRRRFDFRRQGGAWEETAGAFADVLVEGALNPGRNAEAAQMGVSNKNRRLYVTVQYISAHAFRARGGYRLFEVERRSGSDGSL